MTRIAAKNGQGKEKERGLYIPATVQKRVVALHVAGKSNRKIALAERIDRATVGRIVSQKELVQKLAQSQSRVLDIIPKALRVVEAALSSPDRRIRFQAAIKVLEGTGVLGRGEIERTIENANRAASPKHGDERVRGIVGEIVEMTIQKHHTHGISLPDKMLRLLPSAETTGEVDTKPVTTFDDDKSRKRSRR
jgi:hypothetical protein